MTKILITGAGGYIGKSMVSWFSKFDDIKVTTLTRSDVDLNNSVSLDNWMVGKHFDVVIHAAAVGGSRLTVDDGSILDRNLSMFKNVFKHKDKFRKFVSFGSGSEIFSPNSPYGMSKKLIYDELKKYDDCHNIRIYAVFDENELPTRFIKSNVLRCIAGNPMSIHANKLMDFFYMEDLCRLTQHFIGDDGNHPKEIDCSYPKRKTLLEVAQQINDICGKSVDIICSAQDLIEPYVGNSNLPPIDFVGFDAGLNYTIDRLRQTS